MLSNSPNHAAANVSIPLSLRDIASWHEIEGVAACRSIRASVPVLQRGLVWNPSQIELLWDSMFRGFPIGSLVLSAPIEKQFKESDRLASGITHHLLDGQQRCDAIALGFKDPFYALPDSTNFEPVTSILWLDLDPTPNEWSTREYVFRLTTASHPWGYTRHDDAKPLGAHQIRECLKRIRLDPADEHYRRPAPAQLCPQVAEVPVPLSWLLQSAESENLWATIRERLSELPALPWHAPLLAFLDSPEKDSHRERVVKALCRVSDIQIIALCAPADLVDGSRQETESTVQRESISNIEHLFQRLNQQGTPLDGEELAYSMIKAYWPELSAPVDAIEKPMLATRLISLAIRAALTRPESVRLHESLNVSRIRQLAGRKDEQTWCVHNYIRDHLAAACSRVVTWLRYHPDSNPTGLLPVHLSSIARESPDVFLLLLILAERPTSNWSMPEQERARYLQALVTLVHWFGNDKPAITHRLHAACREQVSVAGIQSALVDAQMNRELRPVHSPDLLEMFFDAQSKGARSTWNWVSLGHADKSEDQRKQVWDQWGEFLWFRDQKEILLYAQRSFLHRRFPDYDPSRKDLWAGHNRPWDFDHILASAYIHGKQGDHKELCAQWLNTIGNFRAWPMEDNRSDQAETANDKLARDENQQKRQDSYIEEYELMAFSHGHDTRKIEDNATTFTETCRRRMVRVYREWYEAVGVGRLIAPIPSEPSLNVSLTTVITSDEPEPV